MTGMILFSHVSFLPSFSLSTASFFFARASASFVRNSGFSTSGASSVSKPYAFMARSILFSASAISATSPTNPTSPLAALSLSAASATSNASLSLPSKCNIATFSFSTSTSSGLMVEATLRSSSAPSSSSSLAVLGFSRFALPTPGIISTSVIFSGCWAADIFSAFAYKIYASILVQLAARSSSNISTAPL